jgi:hypothetical protein
MIDFALNFSRQRLVSCPAGFWYFRDHRIRQYKARFAVNVEDIDKERNAVMADSVLSRRARPVRLLAVLRPLAMERPLPAGRAYPEALRDALKY